MKKPKYVCRSAASEDICTELAESLTKKASGNAEIITVTSILPQQGKSYFLFRLAQIIGTQGNSVLIINANSQAPDICENRGLYDISKNVRSADVVLSYTYDTNISNVKIMPLGNSTGHDTSDFSFIFSVLKDNFRYILIELPSLQSESISKKITQHCDKSFILIKSGIINISEDSMYTQLKNHMDSLPEDCQKYIVNMSSDTIRQGYKEIFISGINQMIPEV
ncbi:MAG: hypothetical protein Q4F95_12085 [Oscillospiraceae bacterium]|nr:hypothetical protein [Oscillospiraceae bacterium]